MQWRELCWIVAMVAWVFMSHVAIIIRGMQVCKLGHQSPICCSFGLLSLRLGKSVKGGSLAIAEVIVIA